MVGRVFGWGVFLGGDLHHPLEIKASLSIIYILTMAQVPDTFSHLRHRRPKYRSEMAFILFRPCKRQFHADEIGYFTDAVRQEEHFAALEGVFVLAVRGVFRCTGRFFRGCRTPDRGYGVQEVTVTNHFVTITNHFCQLCPSVWE